VGSGKLKIFTRKKLEGFCKFQTDWRIHSFGKQHISKNFDFNADSNSERELDEDVEDSIPT
jgi:hypothetical protein